MAASVLASSGEAEGVEDRSVERVLAVDGLCVLASTDPEEILEVIGGVSRVFVSDMKASKDQRLPAKVSTGSCGTPHLHASGRLDRL